MQTEQLKPLKVLVLTEGGSGIGFGHIVRCVSLCDAFEENGIIPEIIIHGDETVAGMLKGKTHSVRNWRQEKQWLSSLTDTDVVVIDSYLADRGVYEAISKSVRVPVYIDDNKRMDYPDGIVINGGINAERLNYPENDDVEYLLGCQYIPLRKAFRDVPAKEIRENVAAIMVTFGGDDVRNLTLKVLEMLIKEYPGLSRQIVIGNGCRNVERIEAVADNDTRLHYHPDAETMRNIMLASDIAISAAGQTLYELARVGVPAIAVAVAENQLNNVEGWKKEGFIEYAGWWEDGRMLDNIHKAIKRLEDKGRRKNMSKTGRSLVDGKGAKRIVDHLMNKGRLN